MWRRERGESVKCAVRAGKKRELVGVADQAWIRLPFGLAGQGPRSGDPTPSAGTGDAVGLGAHCDLWVSRGFDRGDRAAFVDWRSSQSPLSVHAAER